MYKVLAIFSGMTLTFMILSNGLLSDGIGNTPSIIFIHITGLIGALGIFLITKESWKTMKGINLFYLFGGLTGIGTVYFTNVSFLALGATVTMMLGLVGRIITSTIIDHYGFFGMKQYPFIKKKLIGMSFIIIGALLIILL